MRKLVYYFINKIKMKLDITKICVESRPEYVNCDRVKKYILKTNLEFEICFGIESTNDIVRNICLNKGVDINQFYSLVRGCFSSTHWTTGEITKPIITTIKSDTKIIL